MCRLHRTLFIAYTDSISNHLRRFTMAMAAMIIMTAAITEGEEFKIRSMGTAGHLVKPFGVGDMLRKVKEALGE